MINQSAKEWLRVNDHKTNEGKEMETESSLRAIHKARMHKEEEDHKYGNLRYSYS